MVDAVLKVLTFFLVVILILILLNVLGGFIAGQIPNAAWGLRRILESLWNAVQNVTQHYQPSHAP